MKVKKAKPGMVRRAGISVKTSSQKLRTVKKGIRRGHVSVSAVRKRQSWNRHGVPDKKQRETVQMAGTKNTQKQEYLSGQRRTQAPEGTVYEDLRQGNMAGSDPVSGRMIQQRQGSRRGIPYAGRREGEAAARGGYADPQYLTGYGKASRPAAGTRAAGTPGAGRQPSTSRIPGVPGDAGKTQSSSGQAAAAGTRPAAGTRLTARAKTAAGAAMDPAAVIARETLRMALKAAKKAGNHVKESLGAAVVGKSGTDQRGAQEETGQAWRKGMAGGSGFLLLLAGIVMLPFLFSIVLLVLILPASYETETTGSRQIVEVARQEAEAWEENIGGRKYKDWYGMDADWCAIFVSWCAEQCGYISAGTMPKAASVSVMRSWYEGKGLYRTKESGYEPKAGDVIIFGNGRSHTGLVAEYDRETGTVTVIEGNTGTSDTTPYHQGSRVKEKSYPITHTTISGYGTPLYPEETVEIPEPYGTEYSYMGWQMITSPSSRQYKLREEAGMNFDGDGFGRIGERYVVACTLTFGQVGDYVDWELDNGTVIKTVIGDIKNQEDEGCNQWGHHNGLCVLEFVVDKASWYGSGKYPTDFHEEWKGRTVRATRVGNYWD